MVVSKYINVGLPIEMIKLIDKVVNSTKFGYKSRGEFVKEAVRTSLKEYVDIKIVSRYDDLINISSSKPE